MKALRSSEYKPAVDWDTVDDEELIKEYLEKATPDRVYAMLEALYRGHSIDKVSEITGIHKWYVERYARISNSAKLETENSIVETVGSNPNI